MGVEPQKEVVDQLKEKLSLLNTLIGNKKYVAADHLTIADLYLYSMMGIVHDAAATGKWDLNQFPNLNKWLERIPAEHPHLVEIATNMNGIEELMAKLRKNVKK